MIRTEVMEFAEAMERVLKENDKEKGDSWKRMEVSRLELLLTREISELCDASFKKNGSKERRAELRKKLIDVSNLAMMVWQRKKEPWGETTFKEL